MGSDVGDRLRSLADQVERLAPSRHSPERFFEDRDEIAQALERMASDADAAARLP